MNASPDAVIREWFQQVWNERREDAIERLMWPDSIAEGWNTFDFLTMYQQIGWIASPVVA